MPRIFFVLIMLAAVIIALSAISQNQNGIQGDIPRKANISKIPAAKDQSEASIGINPSFIKVNDAADFPSLEISNSTESSIDVEMILAGSGQTGSLVFSPKKFLLPPRSKGQVRVFLKGTKSFSGTILARAKNIIGEKAAINVSSRLQLEVPFIIYSSSKLDWTISDLDVINGVPRVKIWNRSPVAIEAVGEFANQKSKSVPLTSGQIVPAQQEAWLLGAYSITEQGPIRAQVSVGEETQTLRSGSPAGLDVQKINNNSVEVSVWNTSQKYLSAQLKLYWKSKDKNTLGKKESLFLAQRTSLDKVRPGGLLQQSLFINRPPSQATSLQAQLIKNGQVVATWEKAFAAKALVTSSQQSWAAVIITVAILLLVIMLCLLISRSRLSASCKRTKGRRAYQRPSAPGVRSYSHLRRPPIKNRNKTTIRSRSRRRRKISKKK